MSASAKGTVERPGSKVRQKEGLNRAILDQSWGETRRQITYKTCWNRSALIVVAPRYTSRTCAACGHVARENRESQAEFRCVACGHEAHADVNAAVNILRLGLSSLKGPTLGTGDWEASASNACAHEPVLKTPEPVRPSRKTRARARAGSQAPA